MLDCYISGTKFPTLYSIAEGIKIKNNSLKFASHIIIMHLRTEDSYPQ